MTLMTPKRLNIQARKLYLEFALMNLDSDETSRDMRTGVLRRISVPFIWAEWFGLASHFENIDSLGFTSQNITFGFETFSKNGFVPKRARQLLAKVVLGGGGEDSGWLP